VELVAYEWAVAAEWAGMSKRESLRGSQGRSSVQEGEYRGLVGCVGVGV
jgi:hypothetical protein